jgi:hypothetical protein
VSIAVFDIDGVVADVRHRLHHLDAKPKDWAGFFSGAGKDSPLHTGISLAAAAAVDHDVVWLTGRPEWMRPLTRNWLSAQGLPANEVIMRRRRDFRPARVMKVEALRNLAARDVITFIDDDPDVIAAAQAAGFPATLADWVPRSSTLAEAQEQIGRT